MMRLGKIFNTQNLQHLIQTFVHPHLVAIGVAPRILNLEKAKLKFDFRQYVRAFRTAKALKLKQLSGAAIGSGSHLVRSARHRACHD